MRLKCRINNKDYEIVQGATFTDEFSEVLDSGTILINHVHEMKDLKPFDDVYIYSDEIPFNGFNNRYIIKENRIKLNKTNKYINWSTSFKMDNNYVNDTGYPVKIEKILKNNKENYKISGHIIEHLIKYTFSLYNDNDDIKYIFYHQDNQNETSSKFCINIIYGVIAPSPFYFDVLNPSIHQSLNGQKYINLTSDTDNVTIRMKIDFDNYCFYIDCSQLENIEISAIDMLDVPPLIDTPVAPPSIDKKINSVKITDKNNKFSRNVSGKEYKKIHYFTGSNYDMKFARWYDIDLIISKYALNYKNNGVTLIKNYDNNYENIDDLVIEIDENDNTKCYIYNKNFYNTDKNNDNVKFFDTYDKLNNWEYNNNLEEGQFAIVGTEGSADREIYIKKDGEIVLFDLYDNVFGKTTLTLSGDYYIGTRTIIEQDINGHRYGGIYHAGYQYSKEIINQDVDKSYNYFLDIYEKIENTNEDTNKNRKFYKHMLVDNYREEKINLKDDIYNYTIQLFSETKYLERIILPNISITQPLKKSEKRSVWKYMNQFLELYSPKIKYVSNDEKHYYTEQQKYTLDPELEVLFGKTYAPDFSLNNPSLRDVISKLMITKDCVPYVEDNVIYAMNISQPVGPFDMNPQYINYIDGSMSSQDYTNNLRTNYNGALSQDNSAHLIEYLGFRNSNESLLTIDNMRLETKFPIYKINKLYMCYYKNVDSVNQKTKELTPLVFLCKQDITPLIKLNAERNVLPSDWYEFNETPPKSINDMGKYKLATIGYDIGSNYITGWGTKYTYPAGWWDKTKTYIQNIFEFVDKVSPYGIKGNDLISKHALDTTNLLPIMSHGLHTVVGPFNNLVEKSLTFGNDNTPLKFKGFVFEIDYTAMYSGTIVHSKDDNFGDVTTVDNPSSSLTLLESDGIFEKEKVNRYGNKAYKINARYNDYSELQDVGTYYDDKIVYRREYSIFDNFISCKYQSSKDYVMKSYYNSVYSKHRPFNLLSMGESTTRAENKKIMILLSKNKYYYENFSSLSFNNFENFIKMTFSSMDKDKTITYINDFDTSDKINSAVLVCNGPNYDDEGNVKSYSTKNYLSDVNLFTNGYSLCFNCRMFDNVSMGVYINKATLQEGASNILTDDVTKDIIGSGQKWNMATDNIETGFLENIGVYFANIDFKSLYYEDADGVVTKDKLNEIYNEMLLKLPYSSQLKLDELKNSIGTDLKICKDNKEILDFTFQLEPITTDKDIIITPWFMKLNDLLKSYNKFEKDITITDTIINTRKYNFYTRSNDTRTNGGEDVHRVYPTMFISLKELDLESGQPIEDDSIIPENMLNKELLGLVMNGGSGYYPQVYDDPVPEGNIVGIDFNVIANKIISIANDKIIVNCDVNYDYRDYYDDTVISLIKKNVDITFKQGWFEEKGVYYHDFDKWEWDGNNVLINSNVKGYLFNNESYPYYIRTGVNQTYIANYPQNMFIIQRETPFNKYLIQEEFSQDDLEDEKYLVTNLTTQDIFSVKSDEFNRQFVYIDLTLADLDRTKKTIEYWYLDTEYPTYENIQRESYHKGSDSYHLVFAVNVTEEDWKRGYIKIYISLVENANMKVFDNQNNLVGYSLNYAEEGNIEVVDGKQKYKPVE